VVDPPSRRAVTAALVLAAGASRRFGAHKLLAPIAGKPLVRWTVECALASAADRVVVVLGRDAEAAGDALAGLPVRLVPNPRYAEGMSTSLRCGVAALDPGTEAVVVLLGDQPLPSAALIDTLIAALRGSDLPIVVPVYDGERGNPVVFRASLFPEPLAVTGDQGARQVIARDPTRVLAVAFPFAPPRDIDTVEDYEAMLREWTAPAVAPERA
jgi:molybdenum cofactor cytidylyltransferase